MNKKFLNVIKNVRIKRKSYTFNSVFNFFEKK
jgi:hypothetical protein